MYFNNSLPRLIDIQAGSFSMRISARQASGKNRREMNTLNEKQEKTAQMQSTGEMHLACSRDSMTVFTGRSSAASNIGKLLRPIVAAGLLFGLAANASAEHNLGIEPENTGWSFQFDNDVFVGGNKDQDYTGGFAVTMSGRRAENYRWSPAALRRWTDHQLGFEERLMENSEHYSKHALEWGAALFTPNDITSTQANPDDRPYASLFFLNSTEQTVFPERSLSLKSSLTLGVLGLDFADNLQSGIHKVLGSTQPEGWDNQISSGGELTARYSLSLQKTAFLHRYSNGLSQEFNWTAEADVGFTTGFGGGFNWRFGRIGTPWWTFNPHQSEYLNLGSNIASGVAATSTKERYVYLGSSVNVNIYNAFLQGQFRDSAVQADNDDVLPVSADAWAGVSVEVVPTLHVEAFVRARTRELDRPDARAPSWAGLIIRRTL